jgi:hypothetical protein
MRKFLRDRNSHGSPLSSELSNVLTAGFVEENGCVLLASQARRSNSAYNRAAIHDDTGYECFINHLHVETLEEAFEFAQQLNKALSEQFAEIFVVIVSFDEREATVRFHRLRPGEAWLTDNLEEYTEEGIAVLDPN